MSGPLGAAALVLAGYLLGAIPVGLVIGRLTRGIDLREYGSHRTGATNALRTLGARWALVVFVLDVAKGAAAVLLARWIFAGDGGALSAEWVASAAGFAAIVGHNWSVFIGFSGGRGVATSTGALTALVPLATLVVAPVVAFIMWRWRFVSLGSISGAALAPVVVAILMAVAMGGADLAYVAYALAAGALVIAAHADNIGRLRAGTERKIGQKERIEPQPEGSA
ncbi:MAG: glycerol-3-phosphate 1-O-acyltransferase PlsY [Candidatus Limnocylindria bacterium]